MNMVKRIISIIVVACFMLIPVTANAQNIESASEKNMSYEDKVQLLAERYGVEISIKPLAQKTSMTAEEEELELQLLEERLAAGRIALQENYRQAEEAWLNVVEAGRCNQNYSLQQYSTQSKAQTTHTVYHYQSIGSYYPNGTTIRCYIKANRVYSDFHNRYLWGTVVSTGSSLYSGYGNNWNETNCTTQRIDGGRTEYVQVWGDLEEKYTSWFTEYTVTSVGWRIWYEAYCPA